MIAYGEEIDFKLSLLSPSSVELLGDFDCGNGVINDYLKKDSCGDGGCVTYLVVDKATRKIIGFASLACSGIHYCIGSYRHTLPAIEIKYFAITSGLHKLPQDRKEKHYYFSDRVLCELIRCCNDITERIIGAEYIVLYSVPEAVSFYRRNGFKEYDKFMNSDNIRFLEGCTPMYLVL